ncbi:nucleotide modification associated domain-containing protein [Romboutsia sp. 1001713B170207_170306_H8]|uniref:nucleotide modification associated domain-containing protein n=1 Tax=Romboutsia sp. 1001713B170207_170306_H8 TaxID=2787112 RepID=UPI001FAD7B85|nr:nucleotide modification associated domain-containing protein [Romboutsia sp. 1001713B170207_170306_H8]
MSKSVCGLCEHFQKGTICKLGYLQDGNEKCIGYKKMEPVYSKVVKSEDDFQLITKEMHELYLIKNKNYGNSFSKQFEEYGLTSVCIRLEDKLRRLKSLNKQLQDSQNGITDVNTDDESIVDTLIDLANYSVLSIIELNKGDK